MLTGVMFNSFSTEDHIFKPYVVIILYLEIRLAMSRALLYYFVLYLIRKDLVLPDHQEDRNRHQKVSRRSACGARVGVLASHRLGEDLQSYSY